jgi:hypothetical protein
VEPPKPSEPPDRPPPPALSPFEKAEAAADSSGEPGTLPPAPRGMSAEEWQEAHYGRPPERQNALSLGRGWLLAVVLLAIGVFLVIAIVLTR